MNVCIQADAVAVGRALVAALLFVGERAASFSEAKFDDTVFGSVLKRWRTHWINRNWPEQFVETGSTRFLQEDFIRLSLDADSPPTISRKHPIDEGHSSNPLCARCEQ